MVEAFPEIRGVASAPSRCASRCQAAPDYRTKTLSRALCLLCTRRGRGV